MPDVYQKLVKSSFEQLPEPIQKDYLSQPVLCVPVEPSGTGFKLIKPELVDFPARESLMPKLGLKSWRDSGGLGIIYKGASIRVVLESLLQHPTPQQQLAAKAWKHTENPLQLTLRPYVDFSTISEARYLVHHRMCSLLSVCLREGSAYRFHRSEASMYHYAREMGSLLESGSWIIELCLLPDGTIKIVDINPGLTPLDLKMLVSNP